MTSYTKSSNPGVSPVDRFDILQASVITFESRRRLGTWLPEQAQSYHVNRCRRRVGIEAGLRTPLADGCFLAFNRTGA